MFLVLSRMAMDILSVQATSVASEFAFSTSGRVLSIRRTRLTSAFLEMYFEEEILDAEVQANEAIPLSDEEIALDATSSEGSIASVELAKGKASSDDGRPRKELEAEVALANILLDVLTHYLDQMCSHGPEMMSVESLLDHSLINYCLNTL
nr:zinc finger BED domain-containing protein RICESLEEPER 2 [Tanacetum cinerariifolium]